MPQFDISTYASQLFWLFVSFFILFALIKWLFLPRMDKALQNRQKHIASLKQETLNNEAKAKALMERYERIIQTAKKEALEIVSSARQQTKQDIANYEKDFTMLLQEKLKEIDRKALALEEEAKSQIQTIAMDLAQETFLRLTGSPVPSEKSVISATSAAMIPSSTKGSRYDS